MSIYTELGLSPIINASGTVTRLGGAPMPDAVLAAYTAAARDSVPIELLQGKACAIISQMTGTESALVTAGAAASLTLTARAAVDAATAIATTAVASAVAAAAATAAATAAA